MDGPQRRRGFRLGEFGVRRRAGSGILGRHVLQHLRCDNAHLASHHRRSELAARPIRSCAPRSETRTGRALAIWRPQGNSHVLLTLIRAARNSGLKVRRFLAECVLPGAETSSSLSPYARGRVLSAQVEKIFFQDYFDTIGVRAFEVLRKLLPRNEKSIYRNHTVSFREARLARRTLPRTGAGRRRNKRIPRAARVGHQVAEIGKGLLIMA